MKGRHQFRRRFSLQPSFLKEEPEDDRHHHPRSQRSEDATDLDEKSDTIGATSAVRHKIVVLGAAKVGKSSLISQFLYNTFSTKYKRTVEEMHQGEFNVAGVQLTLDILDTSGAYEFPAMRALSISSADAFILVYDVNDAPTFEEVRALRDQIHETKCSTAVPIVVVGNKTDLVGTREKIFAQIIKEPVTEFKKIENMEQRRQQALSPVHSTKVPSSPIISPVFHGDEKKKSAEVASLTVLQSVDTAMTESVVTVDWENGFVEASAKDNVNVSKVFKELLVQAKVKYNLSPALRRRRRQSLPSQAGGTPSSSPHPAIPSAVQLQHLQQIRDRHGKRNSCILS